MAYERTNWTDHVVTRPRTYTASQNDDGTITLTPAFGKVITQGTPINAEHLNNLEEGIDEAEQAVASVRLLVNSQIQAVRDDLEDVETNLNTLISHIIVSPTEPEYVEGALWFQPLI